MKNWEKYIRYISCTLIACIALGGKLVQAGISKKAVQSVIDPDMPKIKACYERALQTANEKNAPAPVGKFVVRYTIEMNGDVTSVEIIDDAIQNIDMAACVVTVFQAQKYPKQPDHASADSSKTELGPTVVTYPFVFSSDYTVDPRDMPTQAGGWLWRCDLFFPNASVCNNAAAALQAGVGVAQDLPRALRLYERSCQLASHTTVWQGCYNAAAMYARGQGTEKQDIPKALQLYQLGCSHQDAISCFAVGQLLDQQEKKDQQKSLSLYQQACSLQHTQSCYEVAKLYQTLPAQSINANWTNERAQEEAQKLYHKVCKAGYQKACSAIK